MEFTEIHEKMIRETHDTLIKVSTVLLGASGNNGLLTEVKELHDEQEKLEDEQADIKGKWKLMVGILIGSGVLTGGAVAGIAKVLGG